MKNKNNIQEDRFYIGDYEIYTKKTNGSLDVKRETLHITDDKQKVALIDTELDTNDLILATTIRYQYTNHLDSASLELDETGAIISYEEYHPFGTTSYRSGRSEIDVSFKRYKYVHKELDNETGLYYYGMRYYAPWIARFISVDPLQFKYPIYTPYQYAGNKPISYIDLDGAEEVKHIDINLTGKDLRVFKRLMRKAKKSEIFSKMYSFLENNSKVSFSIESTSSKNDSFGGGVDYKLGKITEIEPIGTPGEDDYYEGEILRIEPLELKAKIIYNSQIFDYKSFKKSSDEKTNRKAWKASALEAIIEEFAHLYQYEIYTKSDLANAFEEEFPGILNLEFEAKVIKEIIMNQLGIYGTADDKYIKKVAKELLKGDINNYEDSETDSVNNGFGIMYEIMFGMGDQEQRDWFQKNKIRDKDPDAIEKLLNVDIKRKY